MDLQCSRVNGLDQSDQDVYLVIGSVMDRKKFFLDCVMLLATTSHGQLLLVLIIFCTDLTSQDGPISSISCQWNWDGIARETMLASLVKRHLWNLMVHGGPLKFCSNTSESQEFHKGMMVTGLQHLLQRIALLCFLACTFCAAPLFNTFTFSTNAYFEFNPKALSRS